MNRDSGTTLSSWAQGSARKTLMRHWRLTALIPQKCGQMGIKTWNFATVSQAVCIISFTPKCRCCQRFLKYLLLIGSLRLLLVSAVHQAVLVRWPPAT